MDFESFITITLLIIFFVLPSIIKKIQSRKKNQGTAKVPLKRKEEKPFIIKWLVGQINEFIQEVEKAGKQQKSEGQKPEDLWKMLTEDEKSLDIDVEPFDSAGRSQYGKLETGGHETIETLDDTLEEIHYHKMDQKTCAEFEQRNLVQPRHRFQKRYYFKSNQLQNAVIWKEILSKPLGLRGEN